MHTPELFRCQSCASGPSKAPLAVGVLTIAGLVTVGASGYQQRQSETAAFTRRMAEIVPVVRIVEAKRIDTPMQLTLPGHTQPYEAARLYARATGYVVERKVDIGSRVKEGELLLRISAPELDHQLAQAEARLGQMQAGLVQAQAGVEQARANVNLAKATDARTATLAGQGWATKQRADDTQANVLSHSANLQAAEASVMVAEANLKEQQAAVDRLKVLTAFERVVAPFDGVVTARNVDVGDLVNADSKTGTPLFSVERDNVLRVSINVPQNSATGVRDGLPASVVVPQLPRRSFTGTVSRSSVALLQSAKTLTTQIDIPNSDHTLRTGLYVYATIGIPRPSPDVLVPSEALIFNENGTQVALVDDHNVVRLTTVRIFRDLGKELEIRDGLSGGERIILSPPPGLQDGSKVTSYNPATSTSRRAAAE
ncbi:RND efflux transporter, MFP subunit [Methylorubrum extorquens DM4]|uniref:RND efflux transporter, MFP subunit n=1 Tax=Methylorubrum extorquens (strain DSM 6343 / CIP 106787 / DM4) TaxID=661410 RepID=C7CBK5_METED|nr:RND efflux transporter, MFP subunit [Methylorubrum extorquens DM4]